jgi:hypothetical protein
VDHDEDAFDLIIPPLTPAAVWLKTLQAVMKDSHRLCKASRRLCEEAADARLKSSKLRRSIREALRPVDLNRLWRAEIENEEQR